MLSAAVALCVFATVFLFVLGVTRRSVDPARARLEAMRRFQEVEPEDVVPSISERLLKPLTRGLVQRFSKLLPASFLSGLELRLMRAGEPIAVGGFLTVTLISTVAVGALALAVVSIAASKVGPMQLAAVALAAGVGFFLPQLWLRQRVGARQAHIIKTLPDAFDLIATCVEAGLGLDAALERVAERVEGPFSEELSRTLHEVSLGKMRRDALQELANRAGVQDLTSFVNAVVQAEQMGSSIGNVLRVQSEQLRVRRRQRAQEQAHKAPVKMIFPLVLCIFPTLFLVILGPAVITIMESFGG